MKTRIIYTKFWEDDFILSLNTKEKCLYNFYLTNSNVGLTGIYELAPYLTSIFTGLTKKEIQTFNEKFMKANKILFYKNWVKIVNASKYQEFTGEKNNIAKNKEISLIPKEIIEKLDTLSIGYQEVSTTGDTLNNHKSIINNHKSIKGDVKGKFAKIEDITPETLEEIAKDYNVPIGLVRLQHEKMINWLGSKGKTYKNYNKALRNWVLDEAKKTIERGDKNGRYRSIDASGV